ncbi:MAG: DUF2304 domain-containing protein [Clostridia bacterium]|nr:DUF2304 domain-containing protein [Clostridia bacterium]
MSSVLRIFLILGSCCFFILIVNMIRTKKLELKYALTWLFTSLSFIILSFCPQIVYFIGSILHTELPVNALFLCIFFLLLVLIFTLTIAVSRQGTRIKCLIQEIGLLKEEIVRYNGESKKSQ